MADQPRGAKFPMCKNQYILCSCGNSDGGGTKKKPQTLKIKRK